MSKQPLSRRRPRIVLSGPKHNVAAEGVGQRVQGLCRFRRSPAGVNSNVAEIMPQARLEERAHIARQPLARTYIRGQCVSRRSLRNRCIARLLALNFFFCLVARGAFALHYGTRRCRDRRLLRRAVRHPRYLVRKLRLDDAAKRIIANGLPDV
jgi:hypothetical protein